MLRSFAARSWKSEVSVLLLVFLCACRGAPESKPSVPPDLRTASLRHAVIPEGLVVGWDTKDAPDGYVLAHGIGGYRYQHHGTETEVEVKKKRHIVIPEDSIFGSDDDASQARQDFPAYAEHPADWIRRTDTGANVHEGVILGWPRVHAEGEEPPEHYQWWNLPNYWIKAGAWPVKVALVPHTVIPESLAVGWDGEKAPEGFTLLVEPPAGPYYQHGGEKPALHSVIPSASIFDSAKAFSQVPGGFAEYKSEPQDWIRRVGPTEENVHHGIILGWPTKRTADQDPPGNPGQYEWYNGSPKNWIEAGPWPPAARK